MIKRIEMDEEGGVGIGRFALAMLMLAFLGLGIQYLARSYGWLGFWMNLTVMILLASILGAL